MWVPLHGDHVPASLDHASAAAPGGSSSPVSIDGLPLHHVAAAAASKSSARTAAVPLAHDTKQSHAAPGTRAQLSSLSPSEAGPSDAQSAAPLVSIDAAAAESDSTQPQPQPLAKSAMATAKVSSPAPVPASQMGAAPKKRHVAAARKTSPAVGSAHTPPPVDATNPEARAPTAARGVGTGVAAVARGVCAGVGAKAPSSPTSVDESNAESASTISVHQTNDSRAAATAADADHMDLSDEAESAPQAVAVNKRKQPASTTQSPVGKKPTLTTPESRANKDTEDTPLQNAVVAWRKDSYRDAAVAQPSQPTLLSQPQPPPTGESADTSMEGAQRRPGDEEGHSAAMYDDNDGGNYLVEEQREPLAQAGTGKLVFAHSGASAPPHAGGESDATSSPAPSEELASSAQLQHGAHRVLEAADEQGRAAAASDVSAPSFAAAAAAAAPAVAPVTAAAAASAAALLPLRGDLPAALWRGNNRPKPANMPPGTEVQAAPPPPAGDPAYHKYLARPAGVVALRCCFGAGCELQQKLPQLWKPGDCLQLYYTGSEEALSAKQKHDNKNARDNIRKHYNGRTRAGEKEERCRAHVFARLLPGYQLADVVAAAADPASPSDVPAAAAAVPLRAGPAYHRAGGAKFGDAAAVARGAAAKAIGWPAAGAAAKADSVPAAAAATSSSDAGAPSSAHHPWRAQLQGPSERAAVRAPPLTWADVLTHRDHPVLTFLTNDGRDELMQGLLRGECEPPQLERLVLHFDDAAGMLLRFRESLSAKFKKLGLKLDKPRSERIARVMLAVEQLQGERHAHTSLQLARVTTPATDFRTSARAAADEFSLSQCQLGPYFAALLQLACAGNVRGWTSAALQARLAEFDFDAQYKRVSARFFRGSATVPRPMSWRGSHLPRLSTDAAVAHYLSTAGHHWPNLQCAGSAHAPSEHRGSLSSSVLLTSPSAPGSWEAVREAVSDAGLCWTSSPHDETPVAAAPAAAAAGPRQPLALAPGAASAWHALVALAYESAGLSPSLRSVALLSTHEGGSVLLVVEQPCEGPLAAAPQLSVVSCRAYADATHSKVDVHAVTSAQWDALGSMQTIRQLWGQATVDGQAAAAAAPTQPPSLRFFDFPQLQPLFELAAQCHAGVDAAAVARLLQRRLLLRLMACAIDAPGLLWPSEHARADLVQALAVPELLGQCLHDAQNLEACLPTALCNHVRGTRRLPAHSRDHKVCSLAGAMQLFQPQAAPGDVDASHESSDGGAAARFVAPLKLVFVDATRPLLVSMNSDGAAIHIFSVDLAGDAEPAAAAAPAGGCSLHGIPLFRSEQLTRPQLEARLVDACGSTWSALSAASDSVAGDSSARAPAPSAAAAARVPVLGPHADDGDAMMDDGDEDTGMVWMATAVCVSGTTARPRSARGAAWGRGNASQDRLL